MFIVSEYTTADVVSTSKVGPVSLKKQNQRLTSLKQRYAEKNFASKRIRNKIYEKGRYENVLKIPYLCLSSFSGGTP